MPSSLQCNVSPVQPSRSKVCQVQKVLEDAELIMLPNQSQRVISHVDLDAFYTQVEVKREPQLKGLPVGTVQYNPFGDLRTVSADEPRLFNDSNGSLIAVSYEARARGVKR